MKVKIVGCGLSGITAAVLLKERGHDVVILDTRNHIGGNCYDSNICGTIVHNYGPHFFHTDDDEVFNFLSRFTEWNEYKYRPKGNTKLGLISLPYSKKTISELGKELSQEEIVDLIFKDYSEKQWGVPFEKIPKTIINRVPKTKDCDNPTWFEGQKYQCMPKKGYTHMMQNMLTGIEVILNCDKDTWKKNESDLTIYTGKIDEYFNYCYGKLPYRSLILEHTLTSEKLNCDVINQNIKTVPYTRMYDHSYFTEGHKGMTIITKEYSKSCENEDIPFYPIPFGDGIKIYSDYKNLADQEQGVIFLGRLATYTYLDMWMAVKQVFLKLKNI
jgi:UDP-galactopyranose mutase